LRVWPDERCAICPTPRWSNCPASLAVIISSFRFAFYFFTTHFIAHAH
jgi:hypothetical protein